MKDKRMLITGVSGLLGNNLAYYFKNKYEVLGLYCSHPVEITGIRTEKSDFLNSDFSMEEVVQAFHPSVIIHCASLANVDQCEQDPKKTHQMNTLSTRRVVEAMKDGGIQLIYISTDAVYDGIGGNFSEEDPVRPLNWYGRSKYEGEGEALKRENSLILRTNLFGWNIQEKKSLGEWIVAELKAGRKIKGFKDARFSTIYTLELARVVDVAIQGRIYGIYNCGSVDACSKLDFAIGIAKRFGLDKTLITPISIDHFDFQAKRGKDLSLNVSRLQKALHYPLPTIDQSIDEFYRDYRCGLPKEIKGSYSRSLSELTFIPYGRQWIEESDIQAVVEVLRSDRITQGPKVEAFEKALAETCGARYAVAVNSGTSALHIACLAGEVGPGSEVITSPITFVASANCAVYCHARPVFADIDPATYNVSPEELGKKVTERTKAVIPVHFAGQSCHMELLSETVREKEGELNHKIYVIEDACHALGSVYKKSQVGSCKFSDMTILSFHPVKHITTGEGGAVLTNDERLYRKLKQLRSHGITNDHEEFISDVHTFCSVDDCSRPLINPWYYEQIHLGYNYRMNDIQSALGLSQIKRLPAIYKRRREIVNTYNEAFGRINPIQLPFESSECESNFHLYVLLFDFEKMNTNRAQFMLQLKRRGIQTQVHYIPVHLHPFYRKHFGTKEGDFPNAEKYYHQCLSLPLFSAMTDQDVFRVIREVSDIVERAV